MGTSLYYRQLARRLSAACEVDSGHLAGGARPLEGLAGGGEGVPEAWGGLGELLAVHGDGPEQAPGPGVDRVGPLEPGPCRIALAAREPRGHRALLGLGGPAGVPVGGAEPVLPRLVGDGSCAEGISVV